MTLALQRILCWSHGWTRCVEIMTTLLGYGLMGQLIHEADPQSRPVVIYIFVMSVRPSFRPSGRPAVPPHFSKSRKTKQFSRENNDRYWRNCGFGRVDHRWHICLMFFSPIVLLKLIKYMSWHIIKCGYYVMMNHDSYKCFLLWLFSWYVIIGNNIFLDFVIKNMCLKYFGLKDKKKIIFYKVIFRSSQQFLQC